MQQEVSKLKAYEGGVPAHAQINVGPNQRAVDYFNSDGEVFTTVVHDVGDISRIAEKLDADLEVVNIGPNAETEADSLSDPVPTPIEEAGTADDLEEELTLDELKAKAKELKIKGRSKLTDKESLAKAIAKAEGQ